VAEVGKVIDRRATDIHRHLAGITQGEFANLVGEGIVESNHEF
jgi:hypothetical protein